MVQGQSRCTTTKANNISTSIRQETSSSRQASNSTSRPTDTTASKTIHRQTARKRRREARQQTAAAISGNSCTNTKGHTSHSRLLDTRRPPVETSPHSTTNRSLRTTANTRRPRCHQAHSRENNNGEANIWRQRIQNR